ncbi:MAG: hypothetical protein B7Z08_12180 [Sphingomonadales bacterium 32-68-7]|nr:MAG: hypothetical protein B7Z33_12435 [Sphingomonadales bacterium 12-68-11]OYX07557.1 MAG: hypothetical protein B7Z08_12180 [Sphingomonadales bacterium 32-68-7]
MARKFLYVMAAFVVLLIAGAFALNLFGERLSKIALVPSSAFVEQEALAANAYRDPAMWFARSDKTPASDPARWRPDGAATPPRAGPAPGAPRPAVFFVHPTSFLDRSAWNAPLGETASQDLARLYVRGMASAFGDAGEVWAPRYRQATFGAFLTDAPEAGLAIDAAYRDVEQAFTAFLGSIDPDAPIVLAGHSQGALHLLRLLRERVGPTPLRDRVAMVYAIGWPISVAHDLPALGFPACTAPGQARCVVGFVSFAEPADPGMMLEVYRGSAGYDGAPRGDSPILCVNPLTGTQGGAAPASANLGTLVPNDGLTDGELVTGGVPARCDPSGLLLIGDPPELGPYALPGNNYHVYDVLLFWRNLQQDVARRIAAWAPAS